MLVLVDKHSASAVNVAHCIRFLVLVLVQVEEILLDRKELLVFMFCFYLDDVKVNTIITAQIWEMIDSNAIVHHAL